MKAPELEQTFKGHNIELNRRADVRFFIHLIDDALENAYKQHMNQGDIAQAKKLREALVKL